MPLQVTGGSDDGNGNRAAERYSNHVLLDTFPHANAGVESSGFQVEGDKVTWLARISIDDWRKLGVAPLEFDTEATVRDGKIEALTATITPQAMERLLGALSKAR